MERKVAYIAHLLEADPRALLVTAADKLHNATAIVSDAGGAARADVWKRFHATPKHVLWYYGAVLDALDAGLPPFRVTEDETTESENVLVRRLRSTVARMGELAPKPA